MTTFDDLGLPSPLRAVLDELGFTAPTPIQVAALPPLLAGRDVLGRARTGSGKTAAFGLPLLAALDTRVRRVQALVLCPTRELVDQVTDTLRTLGRRLPGLRVVAITGGRPRNLQVRALAEGVHVVVATPGRLVDLLGAGAFEPGAVRVAVLDEADRMLDLGFRDDVEGLLGALPADRVTALFSATFPDAVGDISARWQRDPLRVAIDDAPEAAVAIRQRVQVVEEEGKVDALRALLAVHGAATALVFCNLKRTTGEVVAALGQGFAAAALNGDLSQRDRELVLARLRNGSVRVVVATDVAARGLDIGGLDLVVNFDLPDLPETYTHRVGRTGRAGRTGVAVTLCLPRQAERLAALEAAVGPLDRDEAVAAEVAPPAPAPAEMVTLRVVGGRKDKLRKGDLLGALTGDVGLTAADVGLIEIHDHHTFVAVARPVAKRALQGLAGGRIKGRRFRVEPV